MSMPSIASNFFSQPFPVGQMIETPYPASRRVVASCHTRRSNGLGRFSTRNRTRRCLCKIAPFDENGHETGLSARCSAYPELRRLAGRHRAPVDGGEAVPGVLVALAVAGAVALGGLRAHIETFHRMASTSGVNQGTRTRE